MHPVVQDIIYDHHGVCLRLKVWMLKAEVIETPRYGYVTWSTNKASCDMLQQDPTPGSSGDSAGGNGGANITNCPTPSTCPTSTWYTFVGADS